MKKNYVKPRFICEEFIPNEVVSACWGVACSTSDANAIEKVLKNNPAYGHRTSGCGTASKQYIATNSAGVAQQMYERGTYWGTLACTLYEDATYTTTDDISAVKPGDTIYWITKGSGNNIYHHVGKVHESYPGHPNRS